MNFNTVINIDTSTSMIQNISSRTLCLLLLLLSFMIKNTLSNIANSNAGNSIIIPSTATSIEISMISATIPSIRILVLIVVGLLLLLLLLLLLSPLPLLP